MERFDQKASAFLVTTGMMRVKKAGTAADDNIAGIEHGGPKKTEQGETASVFGSVLVQNHQSRSLDRGHEDAAFPLGCRCLGGGEYQSGPAGERLRKGVPFSCQGHLSDFSAAIPHRRIRDTGACHPR